MKIKTRQFRIVVGTRCQLQPRGELCPRNLHPYTETIWATDYLCFEETYIVVFRITTYSVVNGSKMAEGASLAS